MTTRFMLDTHVFYDHATSRVDIASLVPPNGEICYSPITVLELTSKIHGETFAQRREVARAILEVNAHELPDPESHLTLTFGYTLAEDPPSYKQALVALAESSSLEELASGVPDYAAMVERRLNVPFATTWRANTESEWVQRLHTMMSNTIPGFSDWLALPESGRGPGVPKLRGREKETFLRSMQSEDWFVSALLACQTRAFIKAASDDLGVFNARRVRALCNATPKVNCFCLMYTGYLCRLVTEGLLPRENDSGDIDLFLYSTDADHLVVLRERKWLDIATAMGVSDRVVTY